MIDKGTFEKRYDKTDTYEMPFSFLNKILTCKEYRVVREIFIVRIFLDIYCFLVCMFYTSFHPLQSFLNITGLNYTFGFQETLTICYRIILEFISS